LTSYDTIGRGYARHRRADPRIAGAVIAALGDARTVVNVGAGTGSYEPLDRDVVAVEPSVVMIAQRTSPAAPVVRALAERLPFPPSSFDAALAVLTIHHWPDVAGGLGELRRVARRVVILTFDPDLRDRLWLFPEYLPEWKPRTQPLDQVVTEVGAGRVDVVPVPADCTDGFGLAYWRRPEAYLDPEVRACISFFAALPPALVESRMARLRSDIESGAWHRRHRDLLELDDLDLGVRLVVAD
jgi:SAM-dependent methyltransferase